jgi:outer membrane receptor protein involved in Fe transport
LIVRDTVKRTSLAEGQQNISKTGFDFIEQDTGWYERQVLSSQFSLGLNYDPLKVDARLAFANSVREAPFELGFGYSRSNIEASPYGEFFLNRLDNGQTGFGRVAFADLSEDLVSFGLDLNYEFTPAIIGSAGIEYGKTERDSTRREFLITAPSSLPTGVGLLRPDLLLGGTVVEFFGIGLVEATEADPAFSASLETKAAYAQVQAELAEGLELSIGARYEEAQQLVSPLQVFKTPIQSAAQTNLDNDYVLPALTLTYKFADNMQLRLNGSQTIARPQFRELMIQAYYDPDTNRSYRGNPLLVDTEFTNAELRYEWYFAPEQRLSLAAFYKDIDKPIEYFTTFNENRPFTSFANAPRATLNGVEVEFQKYFDVDRMFDSGFLSTRRAVLIANYTWSDSEIEVLDTDETEFFGVATQPARNYFSDGGKLTGQSSHLVNLQLGFEGLDSLSQQTLLISYASDRVFSRGTGLQPDVVESPGFMVDFVVRQGVNWFGQDLELKFEARNLLETEYEEFQERGGNKVFINRYDAGVKFSASVSAKF